MSTNSMKREFKVRALGEIAIRCHDIDAMEQFYKEVIGLEPLTGGHSEGIRFFKIAEGIDGHTSVLALFHHTVGVKGRHPSGPDAPATCAGSSLHHIALSLPYEEQEAVIEWYENKGLDYRIEHFGWVGWRGIFTTDPEGNTVELVAFDKSLLS